MSSARKTSENNSSRRLISSHSKNSEEPSGRSPYRQQSNTVDAKLHHVKKKTKEAQQEISKAAIKLCRKQEELEKKQRNYLCTMDMCQRLLGQIRIVERQIAALDTDADRRKTLLVASLRTRLKGMTAREQCLSKEMPNLMQRFLKLETPQQASIFLEGLRKQERNLHTLEAHTMIKFNLTGTGAGADGHGSLRISQRLLSPKTASKQETPFFGRGLFGTTSTAKSATEPSTSAYAPLALIQPQLRCLTPGTNTCSFSNAIASHSMSPHIQNLSEHLYEAWDSAGLQSNSDYKTADSSPQSEGSNEAVHPASSLFSNIGSLASQSSFDTLSPGSAVPDSRPDNHNASAWSTYRTFEVVDETGRPLGRRPIPDAPPLPAPPKKVCNRAPTPPPRRTHKAAKTTSGRVILRHRRLASSEKQPSARFRSKSAARTSTALRPDRVTFLINELSTAANASDSDN